MSKNKNDEFIYYTLKINNKNKIEVDNSKLEVTNLKEVSNIFEDKEITLIYDESEEAKSILYDKLLKINQKKNDVFFINSIKNKLNDEFYNRSLKEDCFISEEMFKLKNQKKIIKSFYKIMDLAISKNIDNIKIYSWNLFDNYSYELTQLMLRDIKNKFDKFKINAKIIGFTHNYELSEIILEDTYIKKNTFSLIKLDSDFIKNREIYRLRDNDLKFIDFPVKKLRIINTFTKKFSKKNGFKTSKDFLKMLEESNHKYQKSALVKFCYLLGIKDTKKILDKYAIKEDYFAIEN